MQVQPVEESRAVAEQPRPLTIVGIGASAGGLEALSAFFDGLPAETGMTFVVIMHLAPDQPSQLAELLGSHTAMPTVQVSERVKMEPDHVYVIPPGKRIEVTDGHLAVADFEEPRGHRAPIDLFFRSLAEQHGDCAAIILSGSGSDGCMGIKAVKEHGGLLMAQEPEEAAHASMPRAAIATGLVDVILPAGELGQRLAGYKSRQSEFPIPEAEALPRNGHDALGRILSRLHERTGHDFSQYKRSTMLRRIGRRMHIQGAADLPAYLDFLREQPAEIESLFKDLLISVTSFYRDPEAFETLERDILPKIVAGKEAGETVRVWVVGCATGEEAYSLAMLLLEEADKREHPPPIQVFASDLDEAALASARQGLYPEAIITDVTEARLGRFFAREGNHQRAKAELRERVLFAHHNLLKDPPFAHLDLISCRNLLIYLNRDLQSKVFELFHYALRPGGTLFLGSAESVESDSAIFQAVDKEHRIYQRRERAGAQPTLPSLPLGGAHAPAPARHEGPKRPPQPPAVERHWQMLEEHAPPSLLVDADYNLVHLSASAGRYLQHPGGAPTNNVLRLVRPELEPELRSALHRVFGGGAATVARPSPVRFNGAPRRVYLTVRASRGDGGEPLALVLFDEDEAGEVSPAQDAGEGGAPPGGWPQDEVRALQDQLQFMREEYETSEEELRAANEELQSINEEYQSTNEELETSKEELQSMNEELQTLNQELKHKMDEVTQAHGDLQNLFESTEIATLFLDRRLRIRRFTPPVADLLNILPADQGRPISHLTHKMGYDDLALDAQTVLDDLVRVEREILSEDNHWFLVRLHPYRTVDDRIDGVVVTFVDISARREMEQQIRAAREYAEQIVDTVREPLVILDADLRVRSANASFYELFQTRPEATEGQLVYDLAEGRWDIPELRRLLNEILPENTNFNDYLVEIDLPPLGRRVVLLNGRRLEATQQILLAIEDATERQMLQELQARAAEVRALATRLTMAEQQERERLSQLLHDDLQQHLYALQIKMGFLRDAGQAGERERLMEEIDEAETWLGDALQTTRRLTIDLSPPILKNEGLEDALRWLVPQMKELYGLEVKLEAGQAFHLAHKATRLLLFQIARELLFNVVKHAGTRRATVALRREDGRLVMSVSDEGRGFAVERLYKDDGPASDAATGFGLRSVRERVGFLEGRLEVESAPGAGTRVTLIVPLEGDEA